DIKTTCQSCDGKKFRKEILDVKYKGRNIHQVLNMTVAEGMDFFVSYPNIRKPLSVLKQVGLDYLTLGQSTSSLSGGESQRIKIARELYKTNQKGTLYILDEPTTGLHFREVQLLMSILHQIVETGGSVLLIEHNLEVMAQSDYIIDLGPEAGIEGGKIIAQGSPIQICKKKTHTGRYLKEYLRI
ncbi:MAG: ATP-binding cassette domain-containing protein, partial [Pseudomonadota bacterium]